MKRSPQLQGLSREHHRSLVMAKRIARVAENSDDAEIFAAMDLVKTYYQTELQEHFQHEENTMFKTVSEHYPELKQIVDKLTLEHETMGGLVSNIADESAREDLAKFALMLKNHTRMEERELFPLVDTLFTRHELNDVLNHASE